MGNFRLCCLIVILFRDLINWVSGAVWSRSCSAVWSVQAGSNNEGIDKWFLVRVYGEVTIVVAYVVETDAEKV